MEAAGMEAAGTGVSGAKAAARDAAGMGVAGVDAAVLKRRRGNTG